MAGKTISQDVFVPSRGFLFFYTVVMSVNLKGAGFRPLTGISLFLWIKEICYSLHLRFRPLTGMSLFLCILCIQGQQQGGFRPLTGISLFLSYLIFPL